MLSKELRDEFDQLLVERGFSNYAALAKWLHQHGLEISTAGVAKYGHKLELKLEATKRATEHARAIVAAAPDDEAAMNDALIRLIQQIDFEILAELGSAHDLPPQRLAAITRSVASLARATIQQKRWMVELREKIGSHVNSTAEKVAEASRSSGLSADAAAQIRNALMGIHPDYEAPAAKSDPAK